MRRRRTRGNGEGSVYRVPGRRRPWAATVVVGWRDGRPVRRTRFAATRQEAVTTLGEMVAATRAGYAIGPLPTLAEWLDRWLAVVRPTVRETTWRTYAWSAATLSRLLGSIRLRDLRPSHIEEALAPLPWSPHTVAKLRAALREALGLAVRDRLIPDNPAAAARLRRTAMRRQPPTVEQVRALIAALEGHRLQPLVILLASTGLRIGEALGLRWEDVEEDRLHVRWQLSRAPADHDEPWILTPPKTASSKRTVLLAPVAREALRRHRARQAEELLAAGLGRPAHDLVWTSGRGAPLSPATVYHVLEQTGSPLRPHDLRRFAATTAAATGDLLAAQALLGHASAQMTSARYAAATEAALRRAADAAQEVLG